MKTSFVFMTVLALLAMSVVGCALPRALVTGPVPTTGEEANFRFLISDENNAIADFARLDVIISEIGVHQSGESATWHTLNPNPDPDGDGTPGLNLRPLEGAKALAIWEGTLPAGDYTKVFIYVEDEDITGVLLDGDGETADVKLPSNKLQISKPFTISDDSVVEFVYDITVVKAGKNGKYILKPQIAQSGADQDIDDVTPDGDLEIITPSLLPDGVVGEEYEAEVEADGGIEPYTWSIVSDDGDLPDGLELNTETGEIYGTPTTEGEYEFTVQVEDESESVTEEFSISIAAAVGELEITTPSLLPDGVVGEEYEAEVEADGGIESYTWSIVSDDGDLPDGLELNTETGEIYGTPTTAGDYEFTVQVEDDSAQTDTQEFSIHIDA